MSDAIGSLAAQVKDLSLYAAHTPSLFAGRRDTELFYDQVVALATRADYLGCPTASDAVRSAATAQDYADAAVKLLRGARMLRDVADATARPRDTPVDTPTVAPLSRQDERERIYGDGSNVHACGADVNDVCDDCKPDQTQEELTAIIADSGAAVARLRAEMTTGWETVAAVRADNARRYDALRDTFARLHAMAERMAP